MKHFQREDSDYETVETSYSGEWVILPWEAEPLKVSGGLSGDWLRWSIVLHARAAAALAVFSINSK